ncbi:MAG TPA: helix-turn-helix domain-containing protein [Thermoanaerobaculia bacterium]|nr:helix-turn-helix domain-containing protein [Thermoanaerobaculia bacterium]
MGRTARVNRGQVLSAAREAFVERGYEGATLAEIAGRIGVSPAALLRHAPTKRDLFVACMGEGEPETMPFAFLEEMDGSEDPRRVLRRAAESIIPFLESKLRQVVARWVYFKRVAGVGLMPLPFDPASRPTPPQKNMKYLEDYMRRAARRGRLRIADPSAAALAFLATIHSYVFLQHVMEVLEKPMPLERYLETVLDIWTRGAIVTRRKKR